MKEKQKFLGLGGLAESVGNVVGNAAGVIATGLKNVEGYLSPAEAAEAQEVIQAAETVEAAAATVAPTAEPKATAN